MYNDGLTEYSKAKVGTKTLEDATISLGALQRARAGWINKGIIYQAIADNDLATQREISQYVYKADGIYSRMCRHFATMYRYDWYVAQECYDETASHDKVLKEFTRVLRYFDNTYVSKVCAEIALGVIKNGAYYAYLVDTGEGFMIQELPVNYCRSRFKVKGMPAVEFNMSFFDRAFPDAAYRTKILDLFPEEFKKGYHLYHRRKLEPQGSLDMEACWYLLDTNKSTKFSINDDQEGTNDSPMFINAIPSLLDLDAAQDLDRRKQMQKLLKILIQKLPLDKNGDLIFDIDEAKDIHNNAVQMLKRAVGVDVLTTFADIDSVDMSDKNTTATQDDLEKVEREVYNAFGTAQNLFNPNGNLALEKSILDDEGTIRTLVLQFERFFDRVVRTHFTSNKKYSFRFYMLETTQYNYKELAKLYREQAQNGNSKLLSQIALGQSQSSILNMAHFENEVLHLSEVMIPPLMSSTLTMEDIKNSGSSNTGGRPEKEDDQKSEKTIQNKESMN